VRNSFSPRGLQLGTNLGPKPWNMSPRPSKIEARGLRNPARSPPRCYFKKMFNLRGCKGATGNLVGGQKRNLAPNWRPKKLQNRDPNLKKSMLKSDAFSASIFKGFGLHFQRFLGTLGSLKMSISSRRNTDFHVFYPRKCDLEIGTRTNSKKLSFWKDFGLHFCDFFFLKRVLKSSRKKARKKVRKKWK
jgi:hypothetical protein